VNLSKLKRPKLNIRVNVVVLYPIETNKIGGILLEVTYV
jgi:hypothetical protein